MICGHLEVVKTMTALYAARDHRCCGEIDYDVDCVWITCTCGTVLVCVVAFG